MGNHRYGYTEHLQAATDKYRDEVSRVMYWDSTQSPAHKSSFDRIRMKQEELLDDIKRKINAIVEDIEMLEEYDAELRTLRSVS